MWFIVEKRSEANLYFHQLNGSESAEVRSATRRTVFLFAVVTDGRNRKMPRVQRLLTPINGVGDGDEEETHHGDDESVADRSVGRRWRDGGRFD